VELVRGLVEPLCHRRLANPPDHVEVVRAEHRFDALPPGLREQALGELEVGCIDVALPGECDIGRLVVGSLDQANGR